MSKVRKSGNIWEVGGSYRKLRRDQHRGLISKRECVIGSLGKGFVHPHGTCEHSRLTEEESSWIWGTDVFFFVRVGMIPT